MKKNVDDLIGSYVVDVCELKCDENKEKFLLLFSDLLFKITDINVRISIGKSNKKGFISYLSVNINKLFVIYNDGNIYIKENNKSENICFIPIKYINVKSYDSLHGGKLINVIFKNCVNNMEYCLSFIN